jgi:peptidoglycan hydrolase-like protein with peptidoglycan-binding domain
VRRAPAPIAQKPRINVRALERKLKSKGYYKGPIDGVVGNGTRDALKRFQNR